MLWPMDRILLVKLLRIVKNFPTAEEKLVWGYVQRKGTTYTIKGEQTGLPDLYTEVLRLELNLSNGR